MLLLVLLVPAAAPPGPRVDVYGDPLPPGAVARLGSVRLRHPGLSDYAVLPGGKEALTAGSDRALRWWDLASGRPTREVRLEGKGDAGRAVTLSPDGKWLASQVGAEVIVWDAATGKELTRLAGFKGSVFYLYFSPDGATLAANHRGLGVELWKWAAGKRRELTLPAFPDGSALHFGSDNHAAFSPDGKTLVAGASWLAPLGVFDVATGRERYRLDCHGLNWAVSPDGKTLAVATLSEEKGKRRRAIRLFDLKTGKPLKDFAQEGDDSIHSLAVSPDGKTLACSASEEGRLIDLATGRVVHRLPGRPSAFAYSPDGKRLLAMSRSRLRVWDAATAKELHDHPERLGSTLAASPDGRLIASGEWGERGVSVWEAVTGRLVRRLPLKGEEPYLRDLTFSPDGKTLFACHWQGVIQSWDAATGKEGRAWTLKDPDHPRPGGEQEFYRIHLSPDGKSASTLERILAREPLSRLVRWDLATGKPVSKHPLVGEAREAAWSADGSSVVLAARGGLTRIDAEDGHERYHVADAAGVTGSPDGLLFAGRRKHAVGVWEAATGKEVASVSGKATHVAIVPGNRLLLTADEGHVRLWDLLDGKERGRWPLPLVQALRALPDGRAVIALADGTGLVLDFGVKAGRRTATEAERSGWWADLAAEDAGRAYAAGWRLAECPPGFLRRRLRPAEAGDAKAIRAHLDGLDAEEFDARDTAEKALTALGRSAVPELRRALAAKPPLEVRRRMERLLTAARRAPLTADERRGVRAVGLLALGDEHLAELAGGAAGAPLTDAAAMALMRR